MKVRGSVGRFLDDERGALISTEVVLWSTVLVIGLVTGLAVVRFAVVEFYVEQAEALANRESYQFGGPGAAALGGVPIDVGTLTTGEVPTPGTDSGGVQEVPATEGELP